MMHGNLAFNAPSRFIREIPRHLMSVKGAVGRQNTLSGNAAFAGSMRYRGNDTQYTKNGSFGEHSRAFREKDAGHYNPKVTLNNNPYLSLPQKGISAPVQDMASLGYAVGDRVKHIKFGTGTVTDITKGDRDYEVTVDFPAGTKKMLASFAKLKKAED